MTREQIIPISTVLETELAALEDQLGLLSADFYHCFRAGELEQTRDFIRWAGYYEAKVEREARYRDPARRTSARIAPQIGPWRPRTFSGSRMSGLLDDLASYSAFVYTVADRHPIITWLDAYAGLDRRHASEVGGPHRLPGRSPY